MTWPLGVALVFAGALVTLLITGIVRDRRELRRWEAERQRIAAYHERMATRNSRPHTEAVIELSPREKP